MSEKTRSSRSQNRSEPAAHPCRGPGGQGRNEHGGSPWFSSREGSSRAPAGEGRKPVGCVELAMTHRSASLLAGVRETWFAPNVPLAIVLPLHAPCRRPEIGFVFPARFRLYSFQVKVCQWLTPWANWLCLCFSITASFISSISLATGYRLMTTILTPTLPEPPTAGTSGIRTQGHRIKIGGLGQMANSAFGGKLNLFGTYSHLFAMCVVHLVVDNKYNAVRRPSPLVTACNQPPN